MRNFDVVVVGGGAAGLMAAGVAASAGRSVLLCEKMEKPARKVRITGKGRCNLTNMRSEEEFLNKVKSSAEFFTPAFRDFSNKDTVSFFESLGVALTVERGGRVFPTSGRAWDIADSHVLWCRKKGVRIECDTQVTDMHAENGRVTGITLKKKTGAPERICAQNVIIATGGLSYPATGSTGDGYMLAHKLGHTIEAVRPALVPLESSSKFVRHVAGLALKNVSVSLIVDNEVAGKEFGELEFTVFGVSGPVILRLSRRAVDALIGGADVRLSIDLKPALSHQQLLNRIDREIENAPSNATLHNLMRTLMPGKFVIPFIGETGITTNIRLSALSAKDRAYIAKILKNFTVEINDYRPFEEAVITAGGVATEEVDPRTMQSKIVKGLYLAGEVLDIDADTGGYNLQIAYSTGHLAGKLL